MIDSPQPTQFPVPSSSASISAFVGGLPSFCTEDQLTQFMSQFGYVKEVYISKDMTSHSHNGFAFVNLKRVHSMERLFGIHQLGGRPIEVKRSLQEYLYLKNVPAAASEADISAVIRQMGYRVVEILLGGRTPGVPQGVAGVRLSKFYHQEQVSKLRTIKILGVNVSVSLYIPKRKQSACELEQSHPLHVATTRPRSFTWRGNESEVTSLAEVSRDSFSKPFYEGRFLAPNQYQDRAFPDDVSFPINPSYYGTRIPSKFGDSSSPRLEIHHQDLQNANLAEAEEIPPVTNFLREYSTVTASKDSLAQFPESSTLGTADPRVPTTSDHAGPRLKKEVVINFYAFPGHL